MQSNQPPDPGPSSCSSWTQDKPPAKFSPQQLPTMYDDVTRAAVRLVVVVLCWVSLRVLLWRLRRGSR